MVRIGLLAMAFLIACSGDPLAEATSVHDAMIDDAMIDAVDGMDAAADDEAAEPAPDGASLDRAAPLERDAVPEVGLDSMSDAPGCAPVIAPSVLTFEPGGTSWMIARRRRSRRRTMPIPSFSRRATWPLAQFPRPIFDRSQRPRGSRRFRERAARWDASS
jgi:hypothetical protein